MVVLSLIVALLALVVAILALRRADVVDRRVSRRLASASEKAGGHGTEAPATSAQPDEPQTRPDLSEPQSAGQEAAASDSDGQTADCQGPVGRSGRWKLKRSGKKAAGSRTAADLPTGDRGAEEVVDLARRISALESRTFDGISRVAVVRYDAFEGAGGQLSYSLALVDDRGQGLILTAIHGQAETRTYVKELSDSEDRVRPSELSPEEREVLRKATGSRSGRKPAESRRNPEK